MIESINIEGIATYDSPPEVLNNLMKINFLYGSNGSGKTTISKIIADEGIFPTCSVTWKSGTKLQAMVYNRDFVTKNFNQSAELKGIFTLGEENVDTLNKIAVAKEEFEVLTKKVENLKFNLNGVDGAGGKTGELATLDEEIKIKSWAQKQKHDEKLFGAFEGFRGSSEKFKVKILQERVTNTATLEPLVDLVKRAATVFGPTPTVEQSIPFIETVKILAHETNPILKKCVIGKEDVNIASMIKKLGISDWVREGRTFYESNETVCPFCQQTTTDAFAKSLNEYFDETFETDSKAIDDLATNYTTDAARLQQQITSVIATPSKFLDLEKLKTEMDLLDSRFTINTQKIASKKKEPSQIIALESISNVVSTITALIDAANVLIADHNKVVANLAQERRNLTAQVWKYLLEVELKSDLAAYDTKRDGLSKAIADMTTKIATTTSDMGTQAAEIRILEKESTSIQPTIDSINPLLKSFGFRGFSLAKSNVENCYKLVRMDGSDASETLSEGEKSFVTFLYFYHLLNGSSSETGMTTSRVVVFDDPVSSLDSDILFIVSSLIKVLFKEVREGTGHIKQIFVLTHNVYFHKEVTFNPKHRLYSKNDATFWIIRKAGLESKVQKYVSNPIKTSYELLWEEVRKDDRTNLSIQNTLRRILENYFKILGSWDPDEICDLFDGQEKFVCKSLFSWINDGSHSALDDLYASTDPSLVDNYLNLFRAIFEKTGHSEHYKMMMADAYVESQLTPPPP